MITSSCYEMPLLRYLSPELVLETICARMLPTLTRKIKVVNSDMEIVAEKWIEG